MLFDHQAALKDLLARDMNRRQFLLYVGGVIIGMIGITSFLNNLLHQQPKKDQRHVTTGGAYGGGNYSAATKRSTSINVKAQS